MKRSNFLLSFAIMAISAAAFAAPTTTQDKPPVPTATTTTTTTATTHKTTSAPAVRVPPPQPVTGETATTHKTTTTKKTTTTHARTSRRTVRSSATTLEKIRSDATRANALLYDLINNKSNLSHGAWVNTYNEVNMLTNRIYARVRSLHRSGAAVTHARELRASVRQMHKDLAGNDPTQAKDAASQALTHLNALLDALM